VGKWVKATSITGYIREGSQPSKRAQDIAKEYWLCGSCEQVFSNWEREFANKIFYPFVDQNVSSLNYENWMSKFCASLSWRTLTYMRSKNPDDELIQDRKLLLDAAQEHLKKYLLGEVDNLYQYEQHLFPLESIESAKNVNLPTSINRYFLRTLAMDIVENGKNHFIFTKLPSFILLGVIKSDCSKKMRSSRIALKSGMISPRDYVLPYGFDEYLLKKASEIIDLHRKIPQEHLDGFDQYIKENPEKVLGSKQFNAFLDDYYSFGDDVFK